MLQVESGLIEQYREVRKQSVALCDPLRPEDYVVQPVVDVSPPKWHLGHTTWFFEQFILVEYKPGYQVFNDDYAYMFNSYYEHVGDRVFRVNRGIMTRPTVEEIMAYREYVDERMDDFLNSETGNQEQVIQLVTLGLNHEQQHQELLVTDIKYILGHNPLFPVYKESPDFMPSKPSYPQYEEIPEGIYKIGYQEEGFHFDNEKGVHKVFLHAFKLMDRLVTNGEYLQFINDGGYQDFRFWLSEGWDFVGSLETKAPMYWHELDGAWHRFTLNGLKPVNPDAPVTHISFFEADAYARWVGKRLPTEFEWEAATQSTLIPTRENANFVESGTLDPMPANTNQMFGDVWEWTNSAYLPYPYFKIKKGAIGEYNGKFMINQMVLRGGSCATPSNHIRTTYRNFWHPHLRWQFNGFRLAESI